MFGKELGSIDVNSTKHFRFQKSKFLKSAKKTCQTAFFDHHGKDCGNSTGRRPVESENSPGVMPTTKGEFSDSMGRRPVGFPFPALRTELVKKCNFCNNTKTSQRAIFDHHGKFHRGWSTILNDGNVESENSPGVVGITRAGVEAEGHG